VFTQFAGKLLCTVHSWSAIFREISASIFSEICNFTYDGAFNADVFRQRPAGGIRIQNNVYQKVDQAHEALEFAGKEVYDSQSFIDFTGDLHMSLSSTKQFTRAAGILLLALGSCAALLAQEFEQVEDPDTGPGGHIKTLDLTVRVQISGLPNEAEVYANRSGICLDLGCGAANLAVEIAKKCKLTVFALAGNEKDCELARQALDKADVHGPRAIAMAGSLQKLPFPNCYGNLIVTSAYDSALNLKEVLRVLNPNGVAVIGGGAADAGKLAASLNAAGIKDYKLAGNFAIIRGHMPEGVDNWTHATPHPDNINVSHETIVRPPFRTQWMLDAPAILHSPAQGAVGDGYLVFRNGKTIYAWDGFNGQLLWMRPYNGGAGCNHALVDGKFYIKEDDAIMAMDAATGAKIREYRIKDPQWSAAWKYSLERVGIISGGSFKQSADVMDFTGVYWWWLAVENGKLYTLGQTPTTDTCMLETANLFCAFDLKTGDLIWKHELKIPADRSSVALGDGCLYFCDFEKMALNENKLDKKGKGAAHALDATTGAELWSTDVGLVVVASAGGTAVAGYFEGKYMVWCCQDAQGKHGAKAIDAKTGKLVKDYPGFSSGTRGAAWPLLFIEGKMYSSQKSALDPKIRNAKYGYRCLDIASGEELKTGLLEPERKLGCGPGSASANCLFTGGQDMGVFDLLTGKFWLQQYFRSNCPTGAMVGNGLLFHFPAGCHCLYVQSAPMALAPAGVDWKPPEADKDVEARMIRGPAFDSPLFQEGKDEWTHYRGNPGHTGETAAPPRTPLLSAWERKLSGGLTPPSCGGGLIFVASQSGKVWGLDQLTGEIRWKFVCGAAVQVTPAFGSGRVLFGSDDGWLYCVEAKSGQLAWKFRAAPEELFLNHAGTLRSMWPVSAGALIDGNTVYCAAGLIPYDGTYLFALDLKTGKPGWAKCIGDFETEEGAPEGVMALSGDTIIMPSAVTSHNRAVQNKGGTQAYRKTDGEKIAWYPDFPAGVKPPYPRPTGIEAIADGDVFFYGGHGIGGNMYRGPFVLMDTKTGWSCKTGDSRGKGKSSIAGDDVAPVLGKHVLVGDGGGYDRAKFVETMRADPAKVQDAAMLWSLPFGASGSKKDAKGAAVTLALAGDVALAGSESEVAAFEAKADGKELGRVKVPGKIKLNSLAVSNGRVFVTTESDSVVCLTKD
jgi:outer membrane protein assembly factor BamB